MPPSKAIKSSGIAPSKAREYNCNWACNLLYVPKAKAGNLTNKESATGYHLTTGDLAPYSCLIRTQCPDSNAFGNGKLFVF